MPIGSSDQQKLIKQEKEMNKTKIAFITGINGQAGSYLAELLLSKQYEVHGMIRFRSSHHTSKIDHIIGDLRLHYGDVQDLSGLQLIFASLNEKISSNGNKYSRQFEIYHLAAQSHVGVSFRIPQYTMKTNACGTLNVLEAVRKVFVNGIDVRIYNATTSEVYGKVFETPQTETTRFNPRSPYACSKACAYFQCVNYRESKYRMFVSNGILFNHESERRGQMFVTRKITLAINQILDGNLKSLQLGNLDAKRDWSHARDMVNGMHLMLQADKAGDYVLSSDENHSVREFTTLAFKFVGIDIKWTGNGLNEIAKNVKNGRTLVVVNEKWCRPAEVDVLLGDSSKARRELGWKPTINFRNLVKMMVKHDCPSHFVDVKEEHVQQQNDKKLVLVTGGSGLVGCAIQKMAKEQGNERNFVFLSSKMCDLRDENAVDLMFEKYSPQIVIHLAAMVGGLFKNERNNLMMLAENVAMNQNVLKSAHKHNVEKLICCLSTCIYPNGMGQDGRMIFESDLHCGLPHQSNIGYAMAKRMMSVEVNLYNKEYGTNYFCVTPTNIFGQNDNFNLMDSHVIPGLIHKCYLAKEQNEKFVCCGSGKPLRQFIHSLDIAKLIISLMQMDGAYLKRKLENTQFNVTLCPPQSQELSIKDVAEKIAKNFNMNASDIEWDKTMSDGQYQKTASNEKLMELLPEFKFANFDYALKDTVEWFKKNYAEARK